MKSTSIFFLLLLMLLTDFDLFAAEIPYLTGRVTDNAEILSETTRQSLTESLKRHEDQTSNQIAILTVLTINGESIEDYAVKVFEAWELGLKARDNGILIVVVPNDRRMRIEVGYGLEATLTDAMAGRIIQFAMTPKFSGDMLSVNGKIRILPIEFDWLAARTLFPETAVACWSSSAVCDPKPVTALRDALDKGDIDLARTLHRRILHTYETFLAIKDFPEFSKYNIALEKIRFDEAGYVRAGPVRPPYHIVPEEYAEGARENGRRWKALAKELRAQGASV